MRRAGTGLSQAGLKGARLDNGQERKDLSAYSYEKQESVPLRDTYLTRSTPCSDFWAGRSLPARG